MRRPASVHRLTLALATTVGLLGCASGPDPAVDPDADIPLATREKVQESLAHLNNESETERWREGLVATAAESPKNRAFVVRRCLAAMRESHERAGQGVGVLRGDGRRRVMELGGRVGDGPDARELLKMGLGDALDIKTAAAAGLVGYGDDSALPVLVACAGDTSKGAQNQQVALQALRRAATPARRTLLLNALQSEGRDLLRPVVLAAFPAAPDERAAALRDVAQGHDNPYARAFALEVLIDERDQALRDLARRALDDGHPALRPVALRALGASGGEAAAAELARVLAADPEDAADVAKGLYRVGTAQALEVALQVLAEARRKPPTRAAVAREVLARLQAPDAPRAYAEGLPRARAALRDVVEETGAPPAVVVACVEAIGAVGEPGADVEPLLSLLRSPHPTIGPAVVRSLGRLGGDYAAAKLLELIAHDPGLRGQAADALGGLADPRDVPVEEVIDLLESDDAGVRRAALRALLKLAGTGDALGFEPDGSTMARERGVQRWRGWASARRR
ncbi:MAG: HEAT repeat domain-containing protein [Planctomycetes bacterium]|nr:HEAT repeat domain-containing protein [Planctomycetota bacterium]